MTCTKWVHYLCTGINEEDKEVQIVCEFCS